MTTEELNDALSDEVVYQRRKLILGALSYELDLVRQAVTLIEVILDDAPRMADMEEAAATQLENNLNELADVERSLDNAESEVFESLTGEQMMRYEKEAE